VEVRGRRRGCGGRIADLACAACAAQARPRMRPVAANHTADAGFNPSPITTGMTEPELAA
jgi:hypothetical protein